MADPTKRLGGGPEGAEELKKHPWFKGIDWSMVLAKKIKSPFKPRLQSEEDVRYIDDTFTNQKFTPASQDSVNIANIGSPSSIGGNWEGFTYNPAGPA